MAKPTEKGRKHDHITYVCGECGAEFNELNEFLQHCQSCDE